MKTIIILPFILTAFVLHSCGSTNKNSDQEPKEEKIGQFDNAEQLPEDLVKYIKEYYSEKWIIHNSIDNSGINGIDLSNDGVNDYVIIFKKSDHYFAHVFISLLGSWRDFEIMNNEDELIFSYSEDNGQNVFYVDLMGVDMMAPYYFEKSGRTIERILYD